MGFASMSIFTLYSAYPLHMNYKIKQPSPTQTNIHTSLRLLADLQPTVNPRFRPFSSHQLSHVQKNNPVSSPLTCPKSPQKKISQFFSDQIVFLLVGSFMFLGFMGSRPVLAQQVSYSESTEEKRETQDGEAEDEEMYAKLLEKYPKDVEALKVLLSVKMKKGKSKEAVKYVERLIDIEPNEVEWRLLQALCYEMTGQLSKAKRLFKEILKTKPLLLRALHVGGMICFKL